MDSNKKILILVMSCTLPYYRKKEKSIRETWAKPILEGKEPNVDLWFFNSGTKDCHDEKTHRIFVNADDRRDRTFQKLSKTLIYVNNHKDIFDYDYIIRINISSVPNIKLFKELIEHIKDDDLWTSTSFNQPWVANHAPFFSGECFILTPNMINDIIEFYQINKNYFDKLEEDKQSDTKLCCDDGWLTEIFYRRYKDEYTKHLKTYGIVYEPFVDLKYIDKYKDHLVICFKTDDCNNTYVVDKHPQNEDTDQKKREIISEIILNSEIPNNWWNYFSENIFDKECRSGLLRSEEVFCSKQSLIEKWEEYKRK